MSNPLPPAVHGHADQEFQFHHFERGGMPMPQQIADQGPIVGNPLGSLAVADPGRLHDRLIVPHHVDQTDESVVQDGKLLPAQLIDDGGVARHDRPF